MKLKTNCDSTTRKPLLSDDIPELCSWSCDPAPINESPRVQFITANVGSIFEEPENFFNSWLEQVFGTIAEQQSTFVAIHFQEVGGKHFKDNMKHVNGFVKKITKKASKLQFDRVIAFFDENFAAQDKFTALGSIYMIHNSLCNIQIYDFKDCRFIPVTSSSHHLGIIDNVPYVQKFKFPLNYYPGKLWARKGFLRTRWNFGQGIQFDLVNVHLFQDICNLKSAEDPSLYVNLRQKCLKFLIGSLQESLHPPIPYFIFGDLNFRLNCPRVLNALNADIKVKNNGMNELGIFSQIKESNNHGRVILTIGKKEFRLGKTEKHNNTFLQGWQSWIEFDHELANLRDKLTEFPINFPPTYPFKEDVRSGSSYMKTRCPAWCDRVLVSHEASANLILRQSPCGDYSPSSSIVYDAIGKDVCMGDHKPVFLTFTLKANMDDHQPTEVDRMSVSSDTRPLESLNGSEQDLQQYLQLKNTDLPMTLSKETDV